MAVSPGYRNGFVFIPVCMLALIAGLMPVRARADMQIGIEALGLNGTHAESNGSVNDTFVAPVLHLAVGDRRLQFQADYSAVYPPEQTLADRDVGTAISIHYTYSIGR